MQTAVYAGVLVRAAELLGGPDALADYLGVPPPAVGPWLRGEANPPTDIFLRAVDFVVEHSMKGLLKQLRQQADKGSETA